MNHYINLLEPSEVHYQSAAKVPPLFKWVGVGALVLVVGVMGIRFNALRTKAAKGEEIQSTWKRIEKDVEAAKELNTKSMRLSRALETLEGWPVSQYDWPAILDYLVKQSPVPAEDLQLTRFFFDEQMVGLRTQVPGPGESKNYPLKRQVNLVLRGIIRSDRPQRMLPEYRRNVAEGESQPAAVADVELDNPVILMDEEGKPVGIADFTLHVKLKDREVKP